MSGLLNRWHLDNWSDDDFRKHIPAVRKTLAASQAREAEAYERAVKVAEDVINAMRGSGESDLRSARARVTAAIRALTGEVDDAQ